MEVKKYAIYPFAVVEKTGETDLLIYMKSYELQKLFKRQMVLAFSWNRRYSALDYLIKVKEMHFIQTVETIM